MRGNINIALVKYWGKRDENLIIPLNDSLSLTIVHPDIYTETVIEEAETDELILNGERMELGRIERILKHLRSTTVGHGIPPVRIVSKNSFPTGAGMASSASGMAALCLTLNSHFHLQLSPTELSRLARLGSGSACRSLFGGLVQWHAGHDHVSSYAESVLPVWPELRGCLVQVSPEAKAVGSRDGMQQSVKTSRLLAQRVADIPQVIAALIAAYRTRDFASLATLVMRESNQLHAICLDTWPPLNYLQVDSWTVIHTVLALNATTGGIKAAYTFDAGPNALCLYQVGYEETVLQALRHALPPSVVLLPVTFL